MNPITGRFPKHGHASCRMVLRSTFRTLLFLLGLSITWATGRAQDQAPISFPTPRVTFENLPDDQRELADEIIVRVTRCFMEISHEAVGTMPIRVRFTPTLSMGENSHTAAGHIQGVTVHEADSSTIEISTSRTSSWGRIFAHELTHALARATYGKANNRTLSEGLAEYVASELFPTEVGDDMRNIRLGRSTPVLRSYLDGFRFVAQHALDKRFAAFLKSTIKDSTMSLSELRDAWGRPNAD